MNVILEREPVAETPVLDVPVREKRVYTKARLRNKKHYVCFWCGKGFVRKWTLKRHILTFHKGKAVE